LEGSLSTNEKTAINSREASTKEIVNKPNDAAESALAEQRTLRLMETEATRRLALYKTLEFCVARRTASELEATISSLPEMHASLFSTSTLRQWLEDAGGLQRIVSEEEEGEDNWQTTSAGQRVVESMSLPRRLAKLLQDHPKYRDIYLEILHFCLTPKDRKEIESMFDEHPSLADPKIYCTALLGELEDVGALEWAEKWKTAALGAEYCDCAE
jgi:hypothetical protein